MLVNYQATRDQVHILGQKRVARLLLRRELGRRPVPADAERLAPAGQRAADAWQTDAGVEQGIVIMGDGSYSIDQQRYNFQFGGQLFYEIRDGKIVGMLRDVAYQSRTPEFWNAVAAIGDKRGLPARRVVLRRQGPAGTGQRRLARLPPPPG